VLNVIFFLWESNNGILSISIFIDKFIIIIFSHNNFFYDETMKQKTKSNQKITAKEITANIGFLKTKGKLLKAFIAEKKVESKR